MDNTTLVGLARLWGQAETTVLKQQKAILMGYDDIDLAHLLDAWASEFYELPKITALEDFFERKLLELIAKAPAGNLLETAGEVSGNSAAIAEKRIILEQRDLEYETSRFEIECYLKTQPEAYFIERGTTLEQVLNDQELMDNLTHEHRKSVYDYGCDPDWSAKDACDNEPGIKP